MTARLPLVIVAGRQRQLPAGDTIAGVASPLIYASATTVDVNTTASKTALQTIPIPAGALGSAGIPIYIDLDGDYLQNNGTTKTLTIEIAYGGTVMWADVTAASITASASRHSLVLRLRLWNVDGATNAQQVSGLVMIGTPGGATTGTGDLGTLGTSATGPAPIVINGAAAVDSTLAQNLVISVTHNASSANQSVRSRLCTAYTQGQGPAGATGTTGASGAGVVSVPSASQTGTSYSTQAGDVGYETDLTNAAAIAVTVANVLTAGQVAFYCQGGAGQATFSAGAGVTLQCPGAGATAATRAQYSVVAIRCVSSGVYRVVGDTA